MIGTPPDCAEFHIQAVKQEQTSAKCLPYSQCQFDGFRGFYCTDDTGDDAEDAGFLATRCTLAGGWFWEEATVTSITPGEYRRLAFESPDTAINVWFAQEVAGVIQQVT